MDLVALLLATHQLGDRDIELRLRRSLEGKKINISFLIL